MHGNTSIARFLGYSGLIPFVVFSLLCWVPLSLLANPISVLIAYSAVILSFMGAIHWGCAMNSASEMHARHLIISTLPALIAWIALITPAATSLILLMVGFIALYFYDRINEKSQGFPTWYLPMRKNLTLVVSLCLVSALLSIVLD